MKYLSMFSKQYFMLLKYIIKSDVKKYFTFATHSLQLFMCEWLWITIELTKKCSCGEVEFSHKAINFSVLFIVHVYTWAWGNNECIDSINGFEYTSSNPFQENGTGFQFYFNERYTKNFNIATFFASYE